MAENAQREMTLREWVERLPASHLARREYDALTAKAVRMNQAAGGEVVAWMRPEDIAHLARKNGPAKVDAWNCASGPERVPVYTTPPAAQVQQEAVSLIDALDPSNLCHATGTPQWPLNCECPKHATHPAADALGAVRELPAKTLLVSACRAGRHSFTADAIEDGGEPAIPFEVAVSALDAALAQAPAVRVTDDPAIAALRSAQGPDGWVKVADGLPGPSDHVEVWPDPRDDTHSFFAHYDGGTDGVKAGRWYYNDRHGYNHEINVTHWRRVSTQGPISAPSVEGE